METIALSPEMVGKFQRIMREGRGLDFSMDAAAGAANTLVQVLLVTAYVQVEYEAFGKRTYTEEEFEASCTKLWPGYEAAIATYFPRLRPAAAV